MKIIKYLLLLLLILIIAGSIYVATKNGEIVVEESRMIPAPVSLVYEEVNDFSNWEGWSFWGSEEDIILDYSEKKSGEKASFTWENSQMSDGTITTEAVIPEKSISQHLLLENTISDIEGNLYWEFEKVEGGTKVTWRFKDDMNFKEKLAFSLGDGDFSELLKPKFQKGLKNLEKNVLLEMEEYSVNVDGITQHSGGFYLYMTTASRPQEISSKAAEMIKQIKLYMRSNNIPESGKPFILYNQRDERSGTSIISAAVPTPNQIITPVGSPVLNGFLPSHKAIKVTLKGNFKNAPEAWQKGYQYIEDNELEVNSEAAAFEVLYTDPAEEANPALWITEIYIPVL